MKTLPFDPIPAGENPFRHDLSNMGIQIGKNVIIMLPNHSVEPCKWFIVVNTDTGERMKVLVEEVKS